MTEYEDLSTDEDRPRRRRRTAEDDDVQQIVYPMPQSEQAPDPFAPEEAK